LDHEIKTYALPAVALQYRFVSVHRIVGLSGPPEAIPVETGLPATRAHLTSDPNAALQELDRHGALTRGVLAMLFQGSSLALTPQEIDNAVASFIQEREQKFGAGTYLVVEVDGETVSTPSEIKDLAWAGVAFEAVDKLALVEQHQDLIRTVLVATALAVETTPDILKVAEGVTLALPDRRPLYSFQFSMGAAELNHARPAAPRDAGQIRQNILGLMNNSELTRCARLLIDSLRSKADRLEAFIFGWAALEMLIKKFTRQCEEGRWIEAVPEPKHEEARRLHEQHLEGGHQYYSLADKARVFAFLHGIDTVNELGATVTRLHKQFREPLYHEGRFAEPDLPIGELTQLVKQLLGSIVQPQG